jgi:hypothetical protein
MRAISIFILAAAASQLGASDCGGGPIITDPGFDLWCGDSLCAWQVERGSIANVPTWHAGDDGVALIGDDVAISQTSSISSDQGTCVEFDLIANIGPEVDAVLNVDVFDDGVIDLVEHLPVGTWQPVTFQMRMPDTFSGIRFEVAKTGAGSAEVANIGASIVDGGCAGQPAMVVNNRPLGAACDSTAECGSASCDSTGISLGGPSPRACTGCDDNKPDACGSDAVCGGVQSPSPLYGIVDECVALGALPLGAECSQSAECAQGACNQELCSTCIIYSDCANGESCAPAWSQTELAAWECAPGLHHRASGEPCITDADCQSNACSGAALSVCADGRSCASDADCVFNFVDQSDQACTPVGVQGGSCQ